MLGNCRKTGERRLEQMTRYFNTEGRCQPDKHYMVPLGERLKFIRTQYIDRGKYFVINRGRQYGKTTTLMALAEDLRDEYIVVPLDFQRMSTASFADEHTFVTRFIAQLEMLFSRKRSFLQGIDEEAFCQLVLLKSQPDSMMDTLFEGLSRICEASGKPVVMMVDEVDSASNNQVFIDFLAQLRGYYLDRDYSPIFHSVILAGVYDIKNLKIKIRPDAVHQYNSPWNIAADFDMKMSFSVQQIGEMLMDYEADHHTGMDVEAVAAELYAYTSGYPYLVSALCKIMDEKLPAHGPVAEGSTVWDKKGVEEAVKIMLSTKSTLFDSMMKHISEYPDLREMLYLALFCGEQIAYNQDNHTIELACMFGYVTDNGVSLRVANRIFETRLYNFFLSEEELSSAMSRQAKQDRGQFIKDGRLDMERVLEKFVEHFHDIYGENDQKFVENYGRKFFLLYLRPIINGTGNYYIEAQTRDAGRTDVVVDYAGEQFIIELKIWRGNEYNERGEQQLGEYLDYFHKQKGYLLSFNFNKKKEPGVRTITWENKTIVEAVV